MNPQSTQGGYPVASYPYSYSGAPSYYYHPQHTGPVWPPPQPPQAWPVPQPPQSWPAQEPPPPGTGGENSQAPLPSEETEESKAAAAPAVSGWQTSYWHQHWPPPGPGIAGVGQWNGQWPPQQPVYWNTPYGYVSSQRQQGGQPAALLPQQDSSVSRVDQTAPLKQQQQQQEATPPPSGPVVDEVRVTQPRIQQYSQSGYATAVVGPTSHAHHQPADPLAPGQQAKPRGLLPTPDQFAQPEEKHQSWSERGSDDQPPARKRQSRWEPRPETPGDSGQAPPARKQPNTAAPLTPEQWPPKLRDYIDRAFAACEGRAADLERVQQFLKEELNEIFRQNRVWDIDWDSKPLPLDRQQPRPSRWDMPSSPNRDSRLSYQPATPTVGVAGRGRRKKAGFKKKRGGRMFFIDKSGDGVSEADQQRLDQRALRFADGNRSYKKKLSVAELVAAAAAGPREEGDLNWEEFSIEGTSQALEKPYLRLTSAPDPSAVRPLAVLRLSLAHVLSRWQQNRDYHYTCEQFKSIRQDLTIQGIRNEFAVEVYESHARIALENGDRGEFNQCQAQLKALYLEGVPGQQAEFVAYRILYLILTHNSADMSTELRELNSDLKTHAYVAHALRLWSSWQLGNYCQFFRLSQSAPGSGRSLLQLFLSRERMSAVRLILKAFRPSIPIDYVAQALALSPEQCREWFAELELPVVADQLVDCKACLAVLQAKAADA